MNDEIETYKLWRIRKTALELSHDRGFMVTQEEMHQSLEDFKVQFGDKPTENNPNRNDLNLLVQHKDDHSVQMFVFFFNELKVGVTVIRTYIQRMQSESVHKAIFVTQESISYQAKVALQDVAPEYNIEHFLESELMINISQHDLVPQHVVMTSKEKQEFLKKYKLKENQLPRMQTKDPVAKYYGLVRGQVVKIISEFDSAGSYVSYRLVC